MLIKINQQLESKLKIYENNNKFSQNQNLQQNNPKNEKKTDSNLIN